MSEVPDVLPRYNLDEIQRRREQLSTFFIELYHVTLGVDNLEGVVRAIQSFLPGASSDALFETLRQLAGQELLPDRLSRLAWLLAGNLPALKAGRPVNEWSTQLTEEWVPLQILRVLPALDVRNEYGFNLTCRVMAGSPCSQTFTTFRRGRFLAVAARNLGFTNRSGKRPWRDARQLVSLRLMVGLLPCKPDSNELRFEKIRCPNSYLTWNKNILNVRSRVLPCPRHYEHACHRCAIGYTECSAGTHRLNYAWGDCPDCQQQALFDPDVSTTQCVRCYEKAAITREPR